MLPSLNHVATLGLATLATLVHAAPVSSLDKRLLLGSPVDGCALGSMKVGDSCKSINTCLFASLGGLLGGSLDLGKAKLDLGKVLDITTNTCLSLDTCLAVKSNTVVQQTVGGLLNIQVCQKKTCPTLTVLNIDTGICECPLGSVFQNTAKKVCIKTSACSSILSHVVDGVCIPKVCASGTVLLGAASDHSLAASLGACIATDLCLKIGTLDSAKKVCKQRTCSSGTILNIDTGLCECPIETGLYLFADATAKVCIKKSACNLSLNNILDGKICVPKVCVGATALLTSASNKALAAQVGTCIDLDYCKKIGTYDPTKNQCKQKSCSNGHILNLNTGICECPTSNGYLLSGINADVCIKVSGCNKATNNIVGNLCVPKVCAAGSVILGSATEKTLLAKVGTCIDLNLCNLIGTLDAKTGVCKQKKCSSDKILNVSNGLCVCAPTKLLNTGSNLCIGIDTCNTVLNTIVGGLCQPKTCAPGLSLNSDGICICPLGQILGKVTSTCISLDLCLSPLNGVCTALKNVVPAGTGSGDVIPKLPGLGNGGVLPQLPGLGNWPRTLRL